MKCPVCAHENPANAKYCLECGSRFALTCGKCRSELPLSAKFCLECGHPTSASTMPQASGFASPDSSTLKPPAEENAISKSAPEGERRQLTVLFCDLVGFTELANRLDPEVLQGIVRSYEDACAVCITRYEGYVFQRLGDGIVAFFGYPLAHEGEAQRAIHAGLEIISTLSQRDVPDVGHLTVRIGIATGVVVVSSAEKGAVGDTMNLASRLQGIAQPGSVVVSQRVHRLAGGAFDYEDLGEHMLKGISQPARAYRIVGVRQATSRFEAATQERLMPLVGRDQELALLMERWRQARAGEGQGVMLVGEAGIGKSRILRALLDELKGEPHTRVQYQCSPYHADSAFWPVTQQLAHVAGFEPSDTPERRLDRLEALLVQTRKEAAADTPLIAALMGVDGATRYGPLALAPAALRTRTLQALVDHMMGLAARHPMLLVMEDAHWIDPTTLELLERIIDAVAEAPVLVVLTSRPDNQPALAAHPHVTRLALNRLGREGVEAIVAGLGGAKLPEATVAAIVARTDGVPLFVEELTRAVVESGETSVPATLYDTLMARLDRTAEVKEIAQTAACIGREFDFALLAAISERPEAELVAGIDRLGAAELVFRRGFGTGARYIFKHALVRDAAYESLLKSSRQVIHARLVTALEARGMETPPEILARHAELAGMTDRAIREYRHAGDAAGARPAYAEAVANYDAALRLLTTQEEGRGRDEHQLAIEIARGQALMAHFGYAAPKTTEAFAHARVLAEKVGDARSLFHVDWGQWQVSNVQANLPEALVRGRRALAACDPDDPADIRPLAHRLVGSPLVAMGRFAEAATHLQESLACYDPDRHADHTRRFGSDTRALSLIWLASARWFQGAVEAALTDMEASLAFVRQVDNAFARCQGLGHIGVLRALIDPAGADASVAELLASTHRHGVQFFEAVGHGLRTGVRTAQGDHRGALDDAARAREGFSRSGARIFQPLVLNFAAQAQMAVGRFDDAAATLADIDAMIEAGQRWGEAETRRVEGDLMLACGDAVAAEACWRRAIAVAQGQGAASWELRATTRLAGLLIDRGATNDAAILLAEAFKKIDGGSDTPDLVLATTMLRELGATL